MVYLIHLNTKFSHAQHYVGFTTQLKRRIEHHRAGTGAKMLKHVNAAGITWEVARVWAEGDRELERRIKNNSHVKNLCPFCTPAQSKFKNKQKL